MSDNEFKMSQAKEEAEKLKELFRNVKRPLHKHRANSVSIYLHEEHVKQCALICVDEIRKYSNKLISKDLSDLQYLDEIEYELKNL